MRDVVVVGSGHNALVAACYLARAGLDVEVVERDTVVGGAVSTVERWPGYRVDRGSSAHLMIRRTGIVEDLALEDCGLRYLDMDPWAWAPFDDGALTFRHSLDDTCASIAALCGERDALAYETFVQEWGRRNRVVFDAFGEPPTAGRLGRHFLRVGRGGDAPPAEIGRQLLQPADQVLDETFRDERLRTALAWLGAQSGPPTHEPATAELVGWYALMHETHAGRPVGGSGALTAALAERLRRFGGTLRTGDAVTRITRRLGRVDGVETAGGDRIAARAVLAGCHVVTTFELLRDAVLSDRVRSAVRIGDGLGMVVRVGCRELPAYVDAAGRPADGVADGGAYAGMQLLVPSRRHLRVAYGDFLAGRVPAEPAVLAMSFSAADPSIAPPGRHNVSLWAQWHPYRLADASWDDDGVRERVADTVLDQVERLAPGWRSTVEHLHVQTPLDLERELGLLRGNVMHVEMGLGSMFSARPLPELSGYRTPVEGLYLTGASTHPGGGVFGVSGRSAAGVLLADRRALVRTRR